MPLIKTIVLAALPGAQRAATLGALLANHAGIASRISVIVEGMAAGTAELPAQPGLNLHVLAPGCPCCTGSLVLRTTLARVLRLERPELLVIAIADSRHLPTLTQLLRAPPYDGWLEVCDTTAPSVGINNSHIAPNP